MTLPVPQVFTSEGTWNNLPNAAALYILNTPDDSLPNAQSVSLLTSGIVLCESGTGLLSSGGYGSPGDVLTSTGTSVTWSSTTDVAAKYIIQQPNSSLPNAQSLSDLTSGVILNSTGTGILSSAGFGSSGQVFTSTGSSANWQTLSSKYILQQPDSNLPDAQALSDLTSGVLFNTTGTGVLSSGGFGTSGQVLTSTGTSATWQPGPDFTAKYVINTSDASLPNAQVLSTLNTGLLVNTTTTGILSTISGFGTSGQTLTSTGSSASWQTGPSPTAKYIVQTVDASLPNAQSLGTLSSGVVFNTTSTGTGVLTSAGFGTTGQVLTSTGASAEWVQSAPMISNYSGTTSGFPLATGSTGYLVYDLTSTALSNLVKNGDASHPNATLLFTFNISVRWSTAGASRFTYWVGTDQVTGSAYSASNIVSLANIAGTTNPSVSSLQVPVLISSIANTANTVIRLRINNTSGSGTLSLYSIDSFAIAQYYPSGINL